MKVLHLCGGGVKLDSFQIIIDCIREEHDKVRNDNGKSSFDKIIRNICDLCKSNKHVHVLLQINYTDRTLKNIVSILDYIHDDIKNQISIGLHRVWQTVKKDTDKEIKEQLLEVIDKFTQEGFNCSYPETFSYQFYRCYADRFWHTEINYDGNVYKCTMDYSKKPQGKLLDNGTIEWDKAVLSSMYSQATFENKMCKSCKLLPVCGGPCSRKMLEIESSPERIETLCNMNGSEIGYKHLILNYYKSLSKKYADESI